MNVFEKYLDTLREQNDLSRTIKRLCEGYLMSSNDFILKNKLSSGTLALGVTKWAFNNDGPSVIDITYIGEDLKTHERKECTVSVKWASLLINVNDYESNR
jgi:hypothetical protein